jgi:hypothetical protein
MKKTLALTALLAGCASSSPTYAPDGSQAYSLTCSGMCYEKAGQICKERGYEVVAGGTDQSGTVVASRDGLYGGSSHTRNLVIKCKSP